MRFPGNGTILKGPGDPASIIVKLLLLFFPFLLLADLSVGQKKQGNTPPSAEAEGAISPCPLCKFPGRAALFAGTATRCRPDCGKLCCKGTSVVLVVQGITDANRSSQITGALSALEGVMPVSTSPKSGLVKVTYAPEKVTRGTLRSVIRGCGFKITGEQKTFAIEGLTSRSLAERVEEAILREPGIAAIEAVCSVSQRAVVVFDPEQTTTRKITAAINSTPCRVINP